MWHSQYANQKQEIESKPTQDLLCWSYGIDWEVVDHENWDTNMQVDLM